MIISITNYCTMECSHCMLDCKPNNDGFMSMATLDKILEGELFAKSMRVLMTGGEPTEHPDFWRFVRQVLEATRDQKVEILSNGLWAHDKDKVRMMRSLLDKAKNLYVQVTHDKRFYPKKIRRIRHPRIAYVDSLVVLEDRGRAKGMKIENYHGLRRRTGPACFNLRSIIHTGHALSISHGMMLLEMRGKHCSVLIDYAGHVSLSECGNYVVCNVHDDDGLNRAWRTLREDLMPCDRCGRYREMLEEYRIF